MISSSNLLQVKGMKSHSCDQKPLKRYLCLAEQVGAEQHLQQFALAVTFMTQDAQQKYPAKSSA